jgi:CheY-like chemotaxis protein
MKTVLIVDDEPYLRLLYETEVRRAGFSTLSAANGTQCLEYLTTMAPDLVILDMRMPGMDGVEVLQRIIAHDNRIPIVINTAFSSYSSNDLTGAADAIVIKSSDLTELIQTVKKLLPSNPGERKHNSFRGRALNNEERINYAH